MVSIVYWSAVAFLIGAGIILLIYHWSKPWSESATAEDRMGRITILSLLSAFVVTLPLALATIFADVIGARVPYWLEPFDGTFSTFLLPAVVAFGVLLFICVPREIFRQYKATGSFREMDEKFPDTLQTVVGLIAIFGGWLILVSALTYFYQRGLWVESPTDFFDAATRREVNRGTSVTVYNSPFINAIAAKSFKYGILCLIAGGAPAYLLHSLGFGTGNPKLLKNPVAKDNAELRLQRRLADRAQNTIGEWAPVGLVATSSVFAGWILLHQPWDNGVNLMFSGFAAILGAIIVGALRKWPLISWVAAIAVIYNLHLVVEYGTWASAVLPFLIVWCVGWWRQERAKGRRPLLGVAIGGTFALFACVMLLVTTVASHNFLRFRSLPLGAITAAEVSAPNGNRVEIVDAATLEELRVALAKTYPYHPNREGHIEMYRLAIFTASVEPGVVLSMKHGTSANGNSFWIKDLGDYHNVELYEFLSREGILTKLGESAMFSERK